MPSHKHVNWRNGRPRFSPGRGLRAMGYKGTDLCWPDPVPAGWKITSLQPGDKNTGAWFSKGEAVDWSEAFVRTLAKKKARPVAVAARKLVPLYSLEKLFNDWFLSRKFIRPADEAEARRMRRAKLLYAESTIANYKGKAALIEKLDPSLWAAPVDALDQPILIGLHDELVAMHGIASARYCMATLSVAMAWGRRRGKFKFVASNGANPARDLQLPSSPPRVRFGTRPEIEALVAAADAIGMPEVGDMVLLGVWTGQRQADRLELEDKAMLKGRRIFRQAKTGMIVALLEAPELERRLAASAERRRTARAEALLAAATPVERAAVEKRFARIVLNEQPDRRNGGYPWQPFASRFAYADMFAVARSYAVAGVLDVVATAAAGRAVYSVKPCTTLAYFRDQDLRDTAVTWMALSGATIAQIISVTGHSAQSATKILQHYLAQHPEMADAALRQMIAWYDAGGETEIGL